MAANIFLKEGIMSLYIKKIQAKYQVVAESEQHRADIKRGFRDEMKKFVAEVAGLHDDLKFDDFAYSKDFGEMEPQHPVFDLLRDVEKKLDVAWDAGIKMLKSFD